jgi:hypothetical protein
MRQPWIVGIAVAAALAAVVGVPRVFAGDPAPSGSLSAEDQAKITHLVEDLGSADFRVREAATKALITMGAKARPALEAAVKSENPAVRFRADQILQNLNGGNTEKPVDDGQPDPKADPGSGSKGAGPGGSDKMREELERAMRMLRQFGGGTQGGGGALGGNFQDQFREMEKRMKEMEERWKGFTPPDLGTLPDVNFPDWMQRWTARSPRNRDLRVNADGGTVIAEATEGARGARIVLTSKADPSNVATFSGKSIAAILDANPKLREWPGVVQVLGALDEAKAKRAAERADAAKKRGDSDSPFGGGAMTTGRSVKIESSDGRVRVEIAETGPDGKPVTKTYEGTDLETLKAQHPELKEALGGMEIHLGGSGMRFGGTVVGPDGKPLGGTFRFGEKGEDGDKDGEKGEDGEGFGDDATNAKPQTGPFGLGLSPVSADLAGQLSIPEGTGAVVLAVREGSDADKIGLKARDVITKVNDAAVTSIDEMGKTIRGLAKNAALTIEVIRGGKSVTLKR